MVEILIYGIMSIIAAFFNPMACCCYLLFCILGELVKIKHTLEREKQ